ncbi:hypothetical protein [Gehongia tenuis]|uniref:Lipoprotein n=1 Tax=Gehongia tenuis TaxID=2763655 RepID=A0A926D441_9FIRM|nr:hypothetical protein [Gehongia tenuis]MBC8530549.1 hypothetical protein [Gehongia tenuis]
MKRTMLMIAGVVAVALGLTACGGGNSATPSASAKTTPKATPAASATPEASDSQASAEVTPTAATVTKPGDLYQSGGGFSIMLPTGYTIEKDTKTSASLTREDGEVKDRLMVEADGGFTAASLAALTDEEMEEWAGNLLDNGTVNAVVEDITLDGKPAKKITATDSSGETPVTLTAYLFDGSSAIAAVAGITSGGDTLSADLAEAMDSLFYETATPSPES